MANINNISDIWNLFKEYDSSVWFGILAALITFVIEIILCKRGIIFAKYEKKIEKAKKAGKVITAKMINCRYEDREPDNKTASRMYIALYEYTFDGIKRTKQIVSTSVKPPYTISLYYDSNPKKTFSEYDVGKNPFFFILYIIPILVAYFVIKMLGFNG
ncbi:MAG: hypothetical protein IJM37_05390 [Lachnospiraceae bacterium]|nr:hypothetical protein [Lachnospiraceae bacterium]